MCNIFSFLPRIQNSYSESRLLRGPGHRFSAGEEDQHHRGLSGQDILLIITPQAFESALEPLKAHKDYTGIETSIDTLERIETDYDGVDIAEKVKKRIESFHFFNMKGKRFIMLVGDADTFPVRYTQYDRRCDEPAMDIAYYATDLYYAALYKDDGGKSFHNCRVREVAHFSHPVILFACGCSHIRQLGHEQQWILC